MVSEAAGLHISLGHYGGGVPSVSTQVGVLRRLLLEDHGAHGGEVAAWFGRVAEVRTLEMTKRSYITVGCNM